MKLLQIVPGFGIVSNGLSDYARVLENELLKMNIISFYDIQDAVEADAILLSYSGYGYQKRGIPFQLYFQMRALTKGKNIPLYVYFHEVYAGRENIFTSSYWLHPVQKMLYRHLYKLSTSAFCGNEVIFNIIKSENKDASKLHLAPLFSNIPVVNSFPSFEERKEVAVVFGSPGRREAVYKNAKRIQMWSQRLGITNIIDIGPGYRKEWTRELSIAVVAKGKIEPDEVAQWLQTSRYGFISYPENIFGKSGIFAAYAGNAMCVVNFDESDREAEDGLIKNQHYINAISTADTSFVFSPGELSFQLFKWYQPRSAEKHAKLMGSILLKKIK